MSVFVADEQSQPLDLPSLRNLASLVISDEGYPDSAEATLLFVSDEEMSAYNRRFLNREGPTDVLAFPVEALLPGVVPETDPAGPPLLLGDVIVAPSYIERQASEFGVTFDAEMSLMVTHGLLHLLGYDHQNDTEAAVMEGRERSILALIGRERR
jgi:probable rRNA maturation factor